MKKTLCILALGLTISLASSETSIENRQQVETTKLDVVSQSEVVIRETRTLRTAPSNREVRKVVQSQPRLARLNRKIRKERFVTLNLRETRKVRYVRTQKTKHFASLK